MKKSTAFYWAAVILVLLCFAGAARKFGQEVKSRVVTIGIQCAEDGWRMANEHQTLEQVTNAVAIELRKDLK